MLFLAKKRGPLFTEKPNFSQKPEITILMESLFKYIAQKPKSVSLSTNDTELVIIYM